MTLPSPAPSLPPGVGWLELTSPAISRLVALELLAQSTPLGLSEDVQTTLAKAVQSVDDSDSTVPTMLRRLGVFVNTHSLQLMATHQNHASWRAAALAYLVVRQAHFPLLRRLFNATRIEITKVRQATNAAPPPLRHEDIPLPILSRIWEEYAIVKGEYGTEAEQWVIVAQRWTAYPLATLYQALVVDAAIERQR